MLDGRKRAWSCVRGLISLGLISLGLWVAAPSAQAAQDAWKTIETPHFAVHFRSEHMAVADLSARVAEEVYPALTREVGHAPDTRVQLVLADYTDLSNGFADPFFHPKMTILLAVPGVAAGYDSGIGGNEDWLRFVITHELAHILHMDMNTDVAGVFRRFFGRIPVLSAPNTIQSFAFVEGFATLMETGLTRSGRGGSPYFEMFLRAAALDGRLLRMDQALGLYDHREWSPAGTAYLYGYGLWRFIEEKYGADKVREINAEFSRGRVPGVTFAVRKVLGVDLAALWRDWQAELTAGYRRQAEEITARGLTSTRPLTRAGFRTQAPSYAPDGSALVYLAQGPERFPGLRWVKPDGRGDRQLVTGSLLENSTLAWSPDGRRIAYGRVEYENRVEVRSDLYTYDLEKGRESRLTRGQRAADPAWSPDGREIVFVALSPGRSMLRRVDLATGQVSVLCEGEGNAQFASPAWAPDGRRIAVGYKPQSGNWDLAIVEPVNGALEQLWTDAAIDRNPAWTADGRTIFFDSERGGVPNVYAWRLADRRLYQVTNVVTGALDPAPTPGGRSIAFMLYSSAGYDLHHADLEPGTWREVEPPPTPGEGRGAAPQSTTSTALTSMKLGAYNPWPTLRPSFWLPVIRLADQGRVAPGVLTAGRDALGRSSYYTELGYDPSLGGLTADISVGRDFAEDGPQVSLSYIRQAKDQTDVQQGEASATWSYPKTSGSRAYTLSLGETARRSLRTGEVAVSREGAVQLDASRMGGRDARSWARASTLRVARELTGDTYGSAVLGGWAHTWSSHGLSRFRVAANAGLAEKAGALSLGGESDTFHLRGFADDLARGRNGYTLSIEAFPLHLSPSVGYRDVPVFLSRVQGVTFVDAGAVFDHSSPGVETSVGWEMRAGVDLLYGAYPMTLKAGIAVPLTEERVPRFYAGFQLFANLPGQIIPGHRPAWRK